jgi:hypothetical protein
MSYFLAIILTAFALSGCVKREFNKSAANSKSAGVWGTAACLTEERTINEKGRFLTVYTYTSENDFRQVLGQVPNILKPKEWMPLASSLLQKKMERAIEGNLNVSSIEEFGMSARVGYGVYVATDPMQSTGFGEYLIAFDVPTEAPYLNSATGISLNSVRCPFFGIIYKYVVSVSGEKAAALRFDRATHPQGIPFAVDSVRVYRRSWIPSRAESLQLLSGPSDHRIYGPTWLEVKVPVANASVTPEMSFLDNYFHYIDFFSQLRTTRSFPNGPTLNADNTLTSLGVLYALKAEVISRPKWIVEGLERHRNSITGGSLNESLCSPPLKNGLSFDACMLNQLFCSLQHGLDSSLSIGLSLDEATLFSKNLSLLQSGSKPTDYAALVSEILEQWKTDERMTAINKGIQSYNQALQYWKAENLDAFVNRRGR